MCEHADGPEWGYEPHNGPAVWGRLDPAYETCSLGGEQSPIDLNRARSAQVDPVEFEYRSSRSTVENTGHSIQVNPEPGSGLVVGGVRFELEQFHFHHGAEHTIEGVRLPLEMHFVHRSEGGSLVVVGVLFREGPANLALVPVWSGLPGIAGPPRPVADAVDLPALLPEHRTSWRYSGSLTTPPCTEGVAWIVLTEPLTLSAGQIDAFAAIFPNNYRPVQPLGERVLVRG
ncbi:MAG: carbonic anhydrase family protein [Acidobacteria bacterium]|nr:carbonic anhydrase family protein [Acidobacteriota bacterium]